MILRTTWNASTPNPATGGYKIYRKIDDGGAQLIGQVAQNQLFYDDTLSAPTGTHSYSYGVAAVNNTGQGSAVVFGTPQNFTIPEPTPSDPTGVATTQTG